MLLKPRRLASRFVSELTAKPEYSRFRIIGIADGGREIVRVDRRGPDGAIRVVPDAELQRKGDRDYFQAAIRLPPGRLYASPISFYRERRDRKPPRRCASPRRCWRERRPFGILLVNLDMRAAFDLLRDGDARATCTRRTRAAITSFTRSGGIRL